VGVGVKGELYIGGEGLARSYHNRAEMTAEKYVPNPYGERGERMYATGDEVRYREDGKIEFIGRVDRQVKIRGYRVELGEIEAEIMKEGSVKEAAVVVKKGEGGEKRVVGYVVGEEGAEGVKGRIKEYLRARLPEYMQVEEIVELEEMPLSENGKVDRGELERRKEEKEEERVVEIVEARTKTEGVLVEIWKELLKVERASVFDNFFELGGHSLLATRVVSRIEDLLSLQLPLRMLFEYPTIAGLAEVIESGQVEQDQSYLPAIPVIPRGGDDLDELLMSLDELSESEAAELMSDKTGVGEGEER
jgi:acyl carrier protein